MQAGSRSDLSCRRVNQAGVDSVKTNPLAGVANLPTMNSFSRLLRGHSGRTHRREQETIETLTALLRHQREMSLGYPANVTGEDRHIVLGSWTNSASGVVSPFEGMIVALPKPM
jgi:hypothetical protein